MFLDTKILKIKVYVVDSAIYVCVSSTLNTVQVLYDLNDYATLGLYAGSSVILALLAMLLPIETKGKSLKVSEHLSHMCLCLKTLL